MLKNWSFLFLLIITNVWALEIDEKLTLRVLNTSSSKKTVLINRGLEDGLVVGDHAKFFLTKGVVARGVVVKASPTRSVWSVYRIIDPTAIEKNKVMTLKISSPVKVTADHTKSMSPVRVRSGTDNISLPVEKGDVLLNSQRPLSDVDRAELESMHDPTPIAVDNRSKPSLRAGLVSRNWEVWGRLNMNALSSKTEYGAQGSQTGSQSQIGFALGLEWYIDNTSWFRQISLNALVEKNTNKVMHASGIELVNDATHFGAGLKWHIGEDPFMSHAFIPYVKFDFGLGSATEEITIPGFTSSSLATTSTNGSSTFFNLGLGAKYFLLNGFGARAELDFYNRSDSYSQTVDGRDLTKTLSGFRFLLALSYRW